MKKLLAGILAAFFILSACEKDDICDEFASTTPRLVISFYDINNASTRKNVNSLEVIGEGMIEPLSVFTAVDSIALPLRTTQDFSQYRLRINSNDANFDNTDVLRFDYQRNDVYVSRACGYKTLFQLDAASPVTVTDNDPADGLWIQNISVIEPDINNENETHINIYF